MHIKYSTVCRASGALKGESVRQNKKQLFETNTHLEAWFKAAFVRASVACDRHVCGHCSRLVLNTLVIKHSIVAVRFHVALSSRRSCFLLTFTALTFLLKRSFVRWSFDCRLFYLVFFISFVLWTPMCIVHSRVCVTFHVAKFLPLPRHLFRTLLSTNSEAREMLILPHFQYVSETTAIKPNSVEQ